MGISLIGGRVSSFNKMHGVGISLKHVKLFSRHYSQKSLNFNGLTAANEKRDGHFLKKKINELVLWYEQLTGMDEVKEMQNRVVEEQIKFSNAQNKRREANKALIEIQQRLSNISSELDTTTRGEPRYIQLITQEHEVLQEQRRLLNEFSLLEGEERDNFTSLSSFLKQSHEKERAHAERVKYWSIIGSVIGTMFGIICSSISNEFRIRELRKLVKETSVKTASLTSSILLKLENELVTSSEELKKFVNNYNTNKYEDTLLVRLDEILHNNEKEIIVTEQVEHLQERVEELKSMLKTVQNYNGNHLSMAPDIGEMLQKQRNETQLIIASVAFFSLFVPLVISWLR